MKLYTAALSPFSAKVRIALDEKGLRFEEISLASRRSGIVDKPAEWKKARDAAAFRRAFRLDGDTLKRPPRGYPADHPYIEDLKRKDFIATIELDEADALSPRFLDDIADRFRAATPFMKFLCRATGVPY